MRGVVYDAGPLIAAERSDRRQWAAHRARLELGILPLVPAPVVAQVSRSRRRQVQLRRMLRGCEVAVLDEPGAHRAGALLGISGTADLADAVVVSVAAAHGADIATSDRADIQRLIGKTRSDIRVVDH